LIKKRRRKVTKKVKIDRLDNLNFLQFEIWQVSLE